MMEIVNNFQSGFRNGIANNGHVVYCRYGLPHLVCLPINRPDDPLLSPALSHLKAMNGYYAQQFFIHLSDALNSENVISNLYQYMRQLLEPDLVLLRLYQDKHQLYRQKII